MMAMKTINLAKLPVWMIVVIHIFHFAAGETFKLFKGGCSNYTFHAKSPSLTWEQSRQLCKETGLGDLVSIESYAEWIFLKNTILNLTTADEYFIGLRKDGQWKWLSNNRTSLTGLPWAKWEPNGDGNCATMYKDYHGDYGKYNDLHCTIHEGPGYICEFPVDGCNQEDGDKRCSCYTFVNDTPLSWPIAQDSCKFHNKHLVTMETEQEWKFIVKEIQTRKSGNENEWHIGLYKNLTTRKWTWINGKTVTIDKWQKDQPQDVDFYTMMGMESSDGVKGSFSSIEGNINRGWICEVETDNCQGVCMFHNPVQTTTTSTSPVGTASTISSDNCQGVSPRHYSVQTTATSPKTIASPTHDPTRDPEGEKQAHDKDNNALVVIILGSLVVVLSAALLILGVCFLSWRKKLRKDVRNATDARDQLDNQDESSLIPENVARELGFSEEVENCEMRRENQRRETDQTSRQECGYAMLTPRTMMVSGDTSYASLVKTKNGDCINESSVAASPLLQHDDEHHDQLPTYVNVRSANYANI